MQEGEKDVEIGDSTKAEATEENSNTKNVDPEIPIATEPISEKEKEDDLGEVVGEISVDVKIDMEAPVDADRWQNPQQNYNQQGGYYNQQGGYYNQQQGYNQTPSYYQQVDGNPVYYQGQPPPQPVNITRNARERMVNPRRDSDNYLEGMDQVFESSFDDKKIRNRFVQRVYTILFFQLLFSFAFICLCVFQQQVKIFVLQNFVLLIVASVVYLVAAMALMCYASLRRKVPINFVFLVILTVALSYVTGAMSAMYETYIVLSSMGITAAVVLIISIFACQTKWDVTGCGMCLCMISIILMLFGVITIIVSIFTNVKIMFLIYSCLAVLVFCMYLMYDTQQIMGGRRYELSPEEYIYGAVALYIDIMYILIHIMAIMGGRR